MKKEVKYLIEIKQDKDEWTIWEEFRSKQEALEYLKDMRGENPYDKELARCVKAELEVIEE